MPIKIPIKKSSSNKTQTLVKKQTEEPNKPPSPPHPQSQLSPFIDKLSVVLEPLEEDAYDIHSSIWGTLKDGSVFQSAGGMAQAGGWKCAQLIALASSLSRPLLQYRWEGKGPTGKATQFRLEFNPRKVGKQGMVELNAILTSLWPGGWDYVIEHGRISRLDVAVDVPGIRMDEVLFVPLQGASEIRWGRDGHLQSFRHGQPKGNQTLVYSVKQKRLSKGQPWDGPTKVRIERRLRTPSPSKLLELGKLKNPFAGMAFTMMPTPPSGEDEWRWSMFEDSVKVRGVENALALLPPKRRTEYRAYLKQHPKPWWNPEAIWANWPAAYTPLISTGV